MQWYGYLAHFFAGVFLANAAPHFVQGISGHPFQSPFASPPGVGESSPVINALWGFANGAVGYLLLTAVGEFTPGASLDSLVVGVGALATALLLAAHFGRVRGQ